MFRLVIDDDDDSAVFHCPWCGTGMEWPYASTTLQVGDHPDTEDSGVQLAVRTHYLGNTDVEGFEEPCTNFTKWQNTTWRRESSDGRVLNKGKVTMQRDSPLVTR